MKKFMQNLVVILMILGSTAVMGFAQDNVKSLMDSVKNEINVKVDEGRTCTYATSDHYMYLFNKKSSTGETKMVLRVSDLDKVTARAGRLKREIKIYIEPAQNTERIEVLITGKDFGDIKMGYYYIYVEIGTGKVLPEMMYSFARGKKPNPIAIKAMREILSVYESNKN